MTVAVVWEVVSRTFFTQATTWANETTIYLSAMAYLIGGGYALKHRRHVRIDVVYQMFSEAARRRLVSLRPGATVRLRLAPHAPCSTSLDLIRGVASEASRHEWPPSSVHVAESFDEVRFYSALPSSYLAAPRVNRWLGPLTARFRRPEGTLLPGVLLTLLATLGAAAVLRGSRPGPTAPGGADLTARSHTRPSA